MDKIFLTTDVLADKTASSKARKDVLDILRNAGYHVVYFPRLNKIGAMIQFLRILSGTVSRNGHLVIEYPCMIRKRIYIMYLFCRLHRIKMFAVIHDIGALRFQMSKKRDMATIKDMAILKLFDGLISHNPSMTEWLVSKGYRKKIVNLDAFDYYSTDSINYYDTAITEPVKVLYAGNLSYAKATYIYNHELSYMKGFELCVFGQYFEKERMNGSKVVYKGVFNPDAPNLPEKYHFGLIWEGTSIETCDGDFGNYIRYNNPHKFSLYISLGLPVIVWKEAAVASFVLDNNIGFTIGTLDELDVILKGLQPQQYQQYVENVSKISPKVRSGYYLTSALTKLVNA